MPPIDMPMNTAHQHAANAEDYLGTGLLIPAAEEHLKAAEAYQAAVERSTDESTKRTLNMLYNEHYKAAKELDRKIAKLRDEGKDPSLPQKHLPEQQSKASSARSDPARRDSASSHAHNNNTSNRTVPGAFPIPASPMPGSGIGNSGRSMADTLGGTVDESFMLLGGQRSDPGDSFNQFWNIMQGMLENLSQPVAFATAPLGTTPEAGSSETSTPPISKSKALKRDGSLSSDTDLDHDEPMVARLTRKLGMGTPGREGRQSPKASSSRLQASSIKRERSIEQEFDESLLDDDDDFLLIPSGSEPSSSALKKENASLKTEMEGMKRRLEATERALQMRKEQDAHLRDSIFMATRAAQGAMGASAVLQRPGIDLASLNLNVPSAPPLPIPGYNTAREAQYARRVKELEDELNTTRSELVKVKADNTKHRERWAKVKESAKRKKETKLAAEAAKSNSSTVQERIVEEPEAEAEEEEEDAPRAI